MEAENQLDGRREKDSELLQIKDSTRYKNVCGKLGGTIKGDNHRSGKIDSFTRPLPKLYARKEDCCGCAACYVVCPVERFSYDGMETAVNKSEERYGVPYGAICMEEDEEGFLYPVVDVNLCIRCYRCVDVCPIKIADVHKDV